MEFRYPSPSIACNHRGFPPYSHFLNIQVSQMHTLNDPIGGCFPFPDVLYHSGFRREVDSGCHNHVLPAIFTTGFGCSFIYFSSTKGRCLKLLGQSSLDESKLCALLHACIAQYPEHAFHNLDNRLLIPHNKTAICSQVVRT